MTTTLRPAQPLESVHAGWSAADEQFFRITAELFAPAFAQGAGVLLASYDPEPVASRPTARDATAVPAARRASAATAAHR